MLSLLFYSTFLTGRVSVGLAQKVVYNQKWYFVKILAKLVFFCYNGIKQPLVE